MQATHHPLCSHRDGTPTNLTDAEVRRQLRRLPSDMSENELWWRYQPDLYGRNACQPIEQELLRRGLLSNEELPF